MALSGLSARTDYLREARHWPGERRAPQERPTPPEAAIAEPPQTPPDTAAPFDAAFYASRFKADIWRLSALAEPQAHQPPAASDAEPDAALFDFFGNLSVLLVAVRAGDLARAQAAADALEMEALVERGAGRGGDPAPLLDDLVRLLGAAQSRDETAARAAAKALASDWRSALGPKRHPARPDFAPPDPYAQSPVADVGAAGYDTLAQYFDGDACIL